MFTGDYALRSPFRQTCPALDRLQVARRRRAESLQQPFRMRHAFAKFTHFTVQGVDLRFDSPNSPILPRFVPRDALPRLAS